MVRGTERAATVSPQGGPGRTGPPSFGEHMLGLVLIAPAILFIFWGPELHTPQQVWDVLWKGTGICLLVLAGIGGLKLLSDISAQPPPAPPVDPIADIEQLLQWHHDQLEAGKRYSGPQNS